MRIIVLHSPRTEQLNAEPALVRPGLGEGPSPDLFRWAVSGPKEPSAFTIPILQKVGNELATVATARVELELADIKRAACHAATLAPYDYLAGKVPEEEEEFSLALTEYLRAQGRHGKNEAWSHLMSESADAANTRAAWLLKGLSAQNEHYAPLLVYAAAYHVAIRICREVIWVDHTGKPIRAGGRTDWVNQCLLSDVKPVAEAVISAAIAKVAEVAVRPHRGWPA